MQDSLWVNPLWSDPQLLRWFFILLAFFGLGFAAFMASLMATTHVDTGTSVRAAAHIDARPLELHIADSGLILLRSARIVSIAGPTLMLETAWGRNKFMWTVHTDAYQYEARSAGTKFLTRDGTPITINDLQLGDLVTVTGTLAQSGSSFVVTADAVRLSAQ